MNKVAQFEKVSFKQFLDSVNGLILPEDTIRRMYDAIPIPTRATVGSAGYDFSLPFGIELEPGRSILIPTGIRCKMDNDWVLMLAPRSGLGFKFRLQLNNTVGIIDSDYYNSDNEGHIMAKIMNDSNEGKVISLPAGKAFMQGVFLPYGITVDDNASGIRNGGFDSSGK